MNHLDLFSGIGGFSLGLERAGIKTIAFCEFDKHAQKVLKKHWPDVPIYSDVRELTHERLKSDGINGIDIITGGFPCQDISIAGKQAGIKEGTRSGLWSECARLVGEIRPKYAIFENVTALLSGEQGRWFQRVLFDLSEIGYDAEWHCIPASELGAHHHRDRVWIIAYPNLQRCEKFDSATESNKKNQFSRQCDERCNVANANDERYVQRIITTIPKEKRQKSNDKPVAGCCQIYGRKENVPNSCGKRQQGQGQYEQSLFTAAYGEGETINAFTGGSPDIWKVESELGRVADGIPNRSHRLKQLGNAVVPQIPEIIGQAIMQFELNKGIN